MQVPRTEWVLKWPGQVVIAGCQTFWTAEVSATLQDGHLPELYKTLLEQVRQSGATLLNSTYHQNSFILHVQLMYIIRTSNTGIVKCVLIYVRVHVHV